MTDYQREQRKIDRTTIETRVLQLLSQYQRSGDGIRWTTETIAGFLHIAAGGVGFGLLNLMKVGYVHRGCGQWFITAEGRAAFCDECNHVSLQTRKTDLQFRNEVLTGSKEDKGRLVQTSLTNAALPSDQDTHRATNRVEDATVKVCSGVERIRAVARYYEVSPDVASEWCSTGEVHRCLRCGEYRKFHRKNGSNGQLWQASCVECRKKSR